MSVFDKMRNVRRAVTGALAGVALASTTGNVLAGQDQQEDMDGVNALNNADADKTTQVLENGAAGPSMDIDLENDTVNIPDLDNDAGEIDFSDGNLTENLQEFRADLVAGIDAKLDPAMDHLSDTVDASGHDFDKEEYNTQSEHEVFADQTLEYIDLATEAEFAGTGYDSPEQMKADVQIKSSTSSLKGEVWGPSYDADYDNGQSDGANSPVFQDAMADIESSVTNLEDAEHLKNKMQHQAEANAKVLQDPNASLEDKLAASHDLFGGKNPQTGEIETGLLTDAGLLDGHMKTLSPEVAVDLEQPELEQEM